MIHGPNSPDKPTKKQILADQGPNEQPDSLLYLFPLRMTWLILAILGVVIINHALRLVRQYKPGAGKVLNAVPGIPFLIALLRSVSYYRIKPLGPFHFSPMHTIIICLLFSVATITWCFSLHPYYRRTREWGNPPLGMRAGALTIALIPFIFSTALKINPISMLTGISHARLQVYHQNFARLFLFFAITHAVPFIHQPLKDGGYQNLKAYFYSTDRYWSGTVAIVFIAWMVLSSMNVFRNMSYEVFVIQHIVSIIVVMSMLFIHVHKTLNTHLWLWSAVAFWLFSFIGRILMTLYSTQCFTGPKARVEIQTEVSTATDDSSPQAVHGMETFRLSFKTPLRWKAGQHVYVRFPSIGLFEGHPFSIASLPSASWHEKSTMVLVVRVHNGITKRIFNYAQKNAGNMIATISSNDNLHSTASSDTCDTPQIGSSKLDNEASIMASTEGNNVNAIKESVQSEIPQMHSKSISLTAFVDGPYGYSMDPAMFERNVFIAGGTGASFVFPILLESLQRMAKEKCKAITKGIHLIWTMRSNVMIGWMKPVIDEIVSLRSKIDVPVNISFYVSMDSAMSKDMVNETFNVIHGARPDIPALLESEFLRARDAQESSACVYVCGPLSLARVVGNSVAQANRKILRGRMGSLNDIALESETFGW